MRFKILPSRTSLLVFFFSLAFQLIVSAVLGFTSDELKYEIYARKFLGGTLNSERLIDCSPLYFYFHLAVAKYVQWKNFVHFFQAFLQSLSTVLLFKLIRLRFSRLVAIAGTILFVTNSSVIIYTNLSEPETFMIFFLLAYLYTAMKGSAEAALVSGICLSGSLLTRSNLLPLTILTPIFFLLGTAERRLAYRKIVLFVIPILVSVSFLMYRNSTVTGTFTPFSMNPGTVFFEGNNPNSNGESAVYPPVLLGMINDIKDKTPDNPHVLYREFARRIAGPELTIPEVNAFWAEKGRNFLVDHPVLSANKLLYKFYSFFNNYRKHDLAVATNYDATLKNSRFPAIPYALVAALAVAGLVLSFGQWRQYLLFYGVLFSQTLVMIATYVSDRQRVAVIAVLIVLASVAIREICERTRRSTIVLAAVPLLTAAFWYQPHILKDHQYLWGRSQEMAILRLKTIEKRNAGSLADAARMNARCLALTPALVDTTRLAGLSYPEGFEHAALDITRTFTDTSPSARFDYAILLIEAGLPNEAEPILTQLVNDGYSFNRYYRHSSQPHFYLARIAELRNNNADAIAWLIKGLEKNPGDPWILSHLSALTGEPHYRLNLLRYFDDIDAEYLLGKAFLMLGRNEEALRLFSSVMGKVPEYRTGRIYLALAMARAGMVEKAARIYLSAIRIRSDDIFAEQEVVGLFEKWARSSRMPEARYSYGVVLQDFGHYREALMVLDGVLASSPPAAIAQECAGRVEWIRKQAAATTGN